MSDEPDQDNFQRIDEKIELIRDAYKRGEYSTVVRESAVRLESALKKLIRRYLPDLLEHDVAAYSKFNEALTTQGKGNREFSKFMMGDLIGLIKKSDFIRALGRTTKLNVTLAANLQLDAINDLRIAAMHHDYQATAGEADLILVALQICLELLGIPTSQPNPNTGTYGILPADVYHLSEVARRSILTALVKCEQMKHEETRNRIVAQFPASVRVLVHRESNRSADTEAIFDVVNRYRGGILFLLAVLRGDELSGVLKRLNTHLSRPTTWDDALKMITTLEAELPSGNVTLSGMWPAYRDCCAMYPDALVQQDLATFPLYAAVEDLSNRPVGRNKPSALEEFAKALQTAEPAADTAARYLIQVEIDFPLTEDRSERQYRLRRLKLPAPGADLSAKPIFVDQIDSDPVPANRLATTLARDLGELIQRTVVSDISLIEVEFLLPNSLMHLPIETWRVSYIDEVLPLGTLLPVVVRSLERFAAIRPFSIRSGRTQREPLTPHRVELWQARSRSLSTPPREGFWYGDPSVKQPELRARLRDYPHIVCLGFGFPACRRVDVIKACVDYGVPSAVWVRKEGAVESQLQQVEEQLPPADPMQLPRRIWELRKKALADTHTPYIGHNIAVLWDLPDRAAEDAAPHQFQQPA